MNIRQNIYSFFKTDFGRITLFVLITVFFHKLWWYFYTDLSKIVLIAESQGFLAQNIFELSAYIDKYVFAMDIETNNPERILLFKGDAQIQISDTCSGLKQFYQIIVLFVLFPGPWRHKIWYIPMSLFLMHLTNLFRIIFLSFIILWKPEQWDFVHEWVMRPFFYVVIFVLWLVWVEKFVKSDKNIYSVLNR